MTRALVGALAALLAAIAPAASAAPLSLVDERETLGPGITLDHDVTLEPIGFVDRHVVTVDLTRRAVTADLLSSPSVAQGSALTQQANAAGAVAGVNGDFFDINNSNAALGFEIQGGVLRKSGDRNAGQSFGVTLDGVSQLLNLALSATATWGGTARPLSGLNESAIPAGGVGAYTRAWGAYSRALLGGTAEVWVADGRVVRAAQTPEAGALPAGVTALVGREAGAEALRALAVGEPVVLSYALSPEAAGRRGSRSAPTWCWCATACSARTARPRRAPPAPRRRPVRRSASRTVAGRCCSSPSTGRAAPARAA